MLVQSKVRANKDQELEHFVAFAFGGLAVEICDPAVETLVEGPLLEEGILLVKELEEVAAEALELLP